MRHAFVLLGIAVLLLARGASAGDDEKDKKPAAPVDVPGFWTADELRRIDEGLDVLNCTRKDLGFQKRPIDDPFRLPVVNQILDEPLSIGPIAAEWDFLARTGQPVNDLLLHAIQQLAEPDCSTKFGSGGFEEPVALKVESALPSDDVREYSPRNQFKALMRVMACATVDVNRALGQIAVSREQLLRKALLSQVEHPMEMSNAPDVEDARFLTEIQRVEIRTITEWSRTLASITATLIETLRSHRAQWSNFKGTIREHASCGDVVLSGVGDDIHDEDDSVALVIDLGGNDTYTHGASANLLKNRPVSVVIDLAGDDRYIGENDFSFGGALGGVAIQWDCAGNDTYRGGNCSCGAGILGVGVLVDEGGDDVYRVKDFGEGAGAFGIGLLLDKAGNDFFHADLYGQGFASTWGCGMLVELAGNDVYDAGGAHVDTPLWRDRYTSLSQGFAIGNRPDASGGVGVLVDVSGNDRYSCDIFGQGCSYWFSLGLLIDDDGHDTYACGQYGQGSGIHLSCGMLLDRHGQDNYYDANGVGMGGAHDYAVGFLVDRDGDDYYSGGGCAQGSGHTNSVGMLIDDAGNDGYSTVRGISQGSASWVRNTGGIGLLLDGAGKDFYSEKTRDDGVAVRDTIGACIDEPTPENVAQADPMNAAISKEDAAKQVEAQGMKDGAWNLDKLWALVTAWEVGDNTVVMPISREKFVALGAPALDRCFENLNTKDTKVTRAIEKTLEAFPRAEWTPRLVEKTKDADKLVRKNAVLMIANLKVTEALPRLTEMLTSDPDTTGAVLSALAAMKTAPPEVVALLKAGKESVGVQAAVCLGAVGNDAAIEALVAALGPDFAFPVRLAATQQLASLGGKGIWRLEKVVSGHDAPVMQRRNALRALGGTGSCGASGAVNAGMRDENRWIRFSALAAASELLQGAAAAKRDVANAPADDMSVAEAAAWHLFSIDVSQVLAHETDPLVKRLVLPPAKK